MSPSDPSKGHAMLLGLRTLHLLITQVSVHLNKNGPKTSSLQTGHLNRGLKEQRARRVVKSLNKAPIIKQLSLAVSDEDSWDGGRVKEAKRKVREKWVDSERRR